MAFEIFRGRNGNYYFRVKSANGQIVMQSEGYVTKQGVDNAIASFRKNANASSFELRKARSGDSYFVMKAKNGQIIGRSEMYKSEAGAKKGVNAVVRNANGQIKVI